MRRKFWAFLLFSGMIAGYGSAACRAWEYHDGDGGAACQRVTPP